MQSVFFTYLLGGGCSSPFPNIFSLQLKHILKCISFHIKLQTRKLQVQDRLLTVQQVKFPPFMYAKVHTTQLNYLSVSSRLPRYAHLVEMLSFKSPPRWL
ncbi:Hypothetical predicted protein [Podarcis lilfordi]|uniref:Uncharacterized protein n=1 Tax=Podarcis lilfordi TaxID=74358 RepID=A0AA35JUM8_9SAUR|nr:Hypothetical predicted protein [Podarcis lilfordi]